MKAIFKRELRSYFTTPAGYIFLAVFLSANGFLFSFNTLKQGKDSSVESYFTYFIMAFILLIPILTMKTFSEEKKGKDRSTAAGRRRYPSFPLSWRSFWRRTPSLPWRSPYRE